LYRRAFTLIELLVVIAIIAILAAILFPVFAQAKEAAKKTAAISDAKQYGTAMVMYSTDSDDQLPSAYSIDDDGYVLWDSWTGYPAGWDAVDYESADNRAWGNSIIPYTKNYDLLKVFSGKDTKLIDNFGEDAYANPRKTPKTALTTMNGLLSTYSLSAVASPSRLPMLWAGVGSESAVGAVSINPGMQCDGDANAPCRFNPGGPPQAGSTCTTGCDTMFSPDDESNDTVWVIGKGMIFVRTDTSAKYQLMNPNGSMHVEVNGYNDPFWKYGFDEAPQRWDERHRCVSSPGAPRYMSFMRPDTEYNYAFGNSTATPCTQ